MKQSKLLRLLALLFAFTLIAAACGDDDDSGDDTSETTEAADAMEEDSVEEEDGGEAAGDLPDLEGQEITLAIENAYLPFNYIDADTGEAGGWDYDAIEEMCARLNCTPKFVSAAWDGMIAAVSDGQYDMAADGITITDERAEVVDFSDGYINIDQRILVRIGEDRFATGDEFAADEALLIGTQVGTTNYDTAVALLGGEDRVEGFAEFGFAVQALIAGDVDAVIIDETAGQGYVGENKDDVELIGDSLSSDQLGFIFPTGSDLVEPFNAVIAAMKADGSLEEISTEYFADSFTITYDEIEEVEYEDGEAEDDASEDEPAEEETEG